MTSLYKKLLPIFVALQILTVPLFAEPTTHIAYASAWTGAGLAEEINKNLAAIQMKASDEKKFISINQICFTPEWGYAYILYDLDDGWGITNNEIMMVAYASAWTGEGIAHDMQKVIDSLKEDAKHMNSPLDIVDIRMAPEWGYAYIIYVVDIS